RAVLPSDRRMKRSRPADFPTQGGWKLRVGRLTLLGQVADPRSHEWRCARSPARTLRRSRDADPRRATQYYLLKGPPYSKLMIMSGNLWVFHNIESMIFGRGARAPRAEERPDRGPSGGRRRPAPASARRAQSSAGRGR